MDCPPPPNFILRSMKKIGVKLTKIAVKLKFQVLIHNYSLYLHTAVTPMVTESLSALYCTDKPFEHQSCTVSCTSLYM